MQKGNCRAQSFNQGDLNEMHTPRASSFSSRPIMKIFTPCLPVEEADEPEELTKTLWDDFITTKN